MTELRPLVVFDMDGVLINERSSWRLVHEALGTSNEDSFRAYMRGEIDDMEFMRRDIELWLEKGITKPSEVERILQRATLMNGFSECMERLRGSGYVLAIISGGLDLLAERLRSDGGFDHMFANGLATDNNGDLTGEGVLRVPLMDKGSILRSLVAGSEELGPVVVVGDSVVDISMFEVCDLSIAFRPEADEVSGAADTVISEPDLRLVPDMISRSLRQRGTATYLQ